MSDLRYYISGHGHAGRSCQIINTRRRRHSDQLAQLFRTVKGDNR